MADVTRSRVMKQMALALMLALTIGCSGDGGEADGVALAVEHDSIMLENGYQVVPLFKTRTGHLTVTFSVNGKACVFLVDTGGGATLIDVEKKDKYGLEAFNTRDYAAGIGSVSRLVRTSANLKINEVEFRSDSLFLMDISYLNAEFKKYHSRQVDGILGTDFLDRYHAIIDYQNARIYLRMKE